MYPPAPVTQTTWPETEGMLVTWFFFSFWFRWDVRLVSNEKISARENEISSAMKGKGETQSTEKGCDSSGIYSAKITFTGSPTTLE